MMQVLGRGDCLVIYVWIKIDPTFCPVTIGPETNKFSWVGLRSTIDRTARGIIIDLMFKWIESDRDPWALCLYTLSELVAYF